MAVCLLFMMPLIPLAHPFIFAYLVCFSLLLAFSSKILKPGFLRKILSLNFLFPGAFHSAGRKVPVFIFLSFTSGGFLLCAKYAPQFFDIFTFELLSGALKLNDCRLFHDTRDRKWIFRVRASFKSLLRQVLYSFNFYFDQFRNRMAES